MLDYEPPVLIGQSLYQDVLDHLRAAGLPATFTQTGGMCAALEVLLDKRAHALITDARTRCRGTARSTRGWGRGAPSLLTWAASGTEGALRRLSPRAHLTAPRSRPSTLEAGRLRTARQIVGTDHVR